MSETSDYRGRCAHCSGEFVFSREHTGDTIACPHCAVPIQLAPCECDLREQVEAANDRLLAPSEILDRQIAVAQGGLLDEALAAFFHHPVTETERIQIKTFFLATPCYRSQFTYEVCNLLGHRLNSPAPRLMTRIETFFDFARVFKQMEIWATGFDVHVLNAFPAQELERFILDRKATVNLAARWKKFGGNRRGRMIALKPDPIWQRIGEFNLPFPPFELEGQWDVTDVDRDEAERLGLIRRSEELTVEKNLTINSTDFRQRVCDAIALRSWGKVQWL